MNLTRVTAPASYPVTLAEAKAQCSVLHSDEDALILGLVAAATERLDGYSGITGRALVTQTWAWTGWTFPVRLPLPPVQSITAVQYYDTDGVQQTLDSAEYRLTGNCLSAVDTWPSVEARPDAVTVTYTAGYGTASDVPEDLRAAILLMVRFLYDNRGDMPAEVPQAINMLVAPHRAHLI